MPVSPPRTLPTRFRPLWARRVIFPVEALVLVAFLGGAVVAPGGSWGWYDRIALALTGIIGAAFLHRLASVRIDADEAGLTVVNILRSRRLEWAEVLGVRLAPSEPWLVLDLSDGTSLASMGVQGSDGAYARRQAEDLAQLVVEHTRTDRDT